MSLPSEIALHYPGSNPSVYLSEYNGNLVFSTHVMNPAAKFAIESAKSGGDLVHIRASSDGYELRATAKEPVEDTSVWNCTLFRPYLWGENNTVKFTHVQTGIEVRCTQNADNQLTLNSQDPIAVSGMVDYETVVILPPIVAFKGHNGKFVKAYYQAKNNMNHLQCEQDDIGSEWVPQKVYTVDNDGSVAFYSLHFQNYWRLARNYNLIQVDGGNPNASDDTRFQPVRISKNVIALRPKSTSMYLKPLEGTYNLLGVEQKSATLSKECYFEVFEPVIKRTVKKVVYHMDRARVYGHKLLNMASAEDRNPTNTEQTSSVKLAYENKTTRTWNRSNTFSWGGSISVEAKIPFIGGTGIEVHHDESFAIEWGGTEETSQVTEATYNMTVPPRSMAKVTVYATQSTCDIPFSYVQIDTLVDGQILEHTLSDGVFTGVNNYDFYSERVEEPLLH